MTGISTNAGDVSGKFADRAVRWWNTLPRAMHVALGRVHNQAVELVSGGGEPGSYPVPVRTGNLRRAMGYRVETIASGIVFNDAGYAQAIHSGELAVGYRGGKRKRVDGRPFLEDAANLVPPGATISEMMAAAL